MRLRFAAAAAVGTTLTLFLTGCQGEAGNQGTTGDIKLTAAQALTQTSKKAGQTDTFRAELTVSTTAAGATTKIRASGQFRLRPELAFSARLDELARGGQSLTGAGAQAVFTDRVLYAKLPAGLTQFTGGKPWLKVNVNQADQRTGVDLGGLIDQIQKVNPAEQTKMLTASKNVRKVGTEKIDGVQTTHYQGSVTLKEALAQLDPQARQKLQKAYPQGDGKLNFDLWVDGQHLPRKLTTKGAESGGGSAALTVLYSDYGKSVTVSAPPADQVGELSGLFGN
ncbi:hypothetical protein DPM19_10650 [Actinomadura craniellae]|uniref:LppX_LprAFG lipoprotein n=1 Tax=Actinomadura craniellae TaxID=2231787 RepID=A0A365H7W7_9ACTN|nr:LppX_LprAFG lipoprotein [Actinomadura craniellae]RAY15177.1 hypothetical protein DPM19_10650 [Actinomadura craniellae]